jgi:hypothetical protein
MLWRMATYRRTTRSANRLAFRQAFHTACDRTQHRSARPTFRCLTAVRVNWLRLANRLISQLIQCHYRLFPEDSPKAQRRRAAQRKKREEELVWRRESVARAQADLERIYGGENCETGKETVKFQ